MDRQQPIAAKEVRRYIRFAPFLFGFLLSGMMSFIISGIATFRAMSTIDSFFGLWMPSWAVAFPIVLAPVVRRLVARLTHAS